MDPTSIFAHLQDKDAFIVKLPHKFKEYLTDKESFTLTKRDAEIGRIVDQGVNPEHRGPSRPTIEELLAPVENKQDYLMRLNLPRQVIVEEDDSRKKRQEPESKRFKTVVDEVYFDISFPSASEIADFKRTRS